jgi:hypothetical protein
LFDNGLPSVRDEHSHGLPHVQDEHYHSLPNVQVELFHDLPNAQDEPSRLAQCTRRILSRLALCSRIRSSCHVQLKHQYPYAGTRVQSRGVLLADLVHFGQHTEMQFLHTLSRYVTRCAILLRQHLVPLLPMLVHVLSNVYAVFEHAYVFPENQHHAAILVRIEIMRFFQRSHDFAALKRRMGQKLSRPAYSMLYNLSWSAFSYLCPSTTCSRGVRMQCFFVGRRLPRRPISSSRVLDSRSPLSSMTVTLPSESRVGGGSSRLSSASVLPYIVSKPSILNNRSFLHYVAYVDNVSLKAYPSDKFVHACIPLPMVSQLLSITVSRYVAKMHSIAVGSRCTVAQLKTNVDEHECLGCPSYITVFSVEHDSTSKNTARVRKHREKQKTQSPM